MVGQVRKIILLVFIPINGFILVPQFINLLGMIKNGKEDNEKIKKKCIIILVTFIILVIFECSYFKNIQTGIINYINGKQ